MRRVIQPGNEYRDARKVKKDLCDQGIIGEKLFQRVVEERIKKQKVTLCDP